MGPGVNGRRAASMGQADTRLIGHQRRNGGIQSLGIAWACRSLPGRQRRLAG